MLRKREKLTQQELSKKLDISPITISKLDNGENATLETILKVLQYFDELNSLNRFIQTKIENLNDTKSLY